MNFTNWIAASLFLVFLKIPRLMPATMLVTGFPPAGSCAGSGTGATPMSSGFMPNSFSEACAACQKTIEVVPVAKSFSASVPFEYWASLGFTILSVCMKSMYCLIAATFCGVLNVALPDESNHDPPCCWLNVKALWMFSVLLPASSDNAQCFGVVSFLASTANSSQRLHVEPAAGWVVVRLVRQGDVQHAAECCGDQAVHRLHADRQDREPERRPVLKRHGSAEGLRDGYDLNGLLAGGAGLAQAAGHES